MERPNKKDYLTTNQIEYNQMLNKYYDDLEAYIDILEEQQFLEALEKINKAYDNAGLKANYTPEMRNALTSMKITLLVNAT
tara:strand:+ start:362 stop:604 length:243 start_codon:yes stop_codon:yes gene_type:complete